MATPTPKKEEDTDEGKKREAETPDPNPKDIKNPKTETGGSMDAVHQVSHRVQSQCQFAGPILVMAMDGVISSQNPARARPVYSQCLPPRRC